jgi:hypothetical protein
MPRDQTSSILAAQYGITMKAVRDIWNLRTWAWTTMPFWTQSDHDQFLRKHLCEKCRRDGVQSISSACSRCAMPRRRGRPSKNTAATTTQEPAMPIAYKLTNIFCNDARMPERRFVDGEQQQNTASVSAPMRANIVHIGMSALSDMASGPWDHASSHHGPSLGHQIQMRHAAEYDFQGRDSCRQQQTSTCPQHTCPHMWACGPPNSRCDNLGHAASHFHGACHSTYSRSEQDCAKMPTLCHSSFASSSNAFAAAWDHRNMSNNKVSMRGCDQEHQEMPSHFESPRELEKESRETSEQWMHCWHSLADFKDSGGSMLSDASTSVGAPPACGGGAGGYTGAWSSVASNISGQHVKSNSDDYTSMTIHSDDYTCASTGIQEWSRRASSSSMCAAPAAIPTPMQVHSDAPTAPFHVGHGPKSFSMNASAWEEEEEERWRGWSPAEAGACMYW